MKGLVDPENISHNADYDQHLSASPPIPPSENDTLEYGSRRRAHIEPRYSITEKFEDHESNSVHRDYESTNDIDPRTELSPILNDQIRKRRKDSICDNPLLPHKRLTRVPSESHVSVIIFTYLYIYFFLSTLFLLSSWILYCFFLCCCF